MSSTWPDCVVSVIDVIGIKRAATAGGSNASDMMRRMHALCEGMFNDGMNAHSHAYCWNDSVLLLANWDKSSTNAMAILSEVSELKVRIDNSIGSSYAICIKGRRFPDQIPEAARVYVSGEHQQRFTTIKASSFAMANCYMVEAEAKKQKLKRNWYIDSRLKDALPEGQYETMSVRMLPDDKPREVLLLDAFS